MNDLETVRRIPGEPPQVHEVRKMHRQPPGLRPDGVPSPPVRIWRRLAALTNCSIPGEFIPA